MGTARVLVVDAEPSSRAAIREALRAADVACAEADTCDAALVATERDDSVAAVLLDLASGSQALALLRRLREQRPWIQVVALASPPAQQAVIEALRLGAADYLAKPLHEEELLLCVRRCLADHALERRHRRLLRRLRELAEWLGELGQRASESNPALAGAAARAGTRLTAAADDAGGGEGADRELLEALAACSDALLDPPTPGPEAGAMREAGVLEMVRGICEVVHDEVEPARLLERALGPVARALSAPTVSLYLIDGRTGELVREAQGPDGGRPDRDRLPCDRGLTGGVARTGALVASDDPEADPRFEAAVDTPADGITAPLVCVPLRLRGRLFGVARAFPADGGRSSAQAGELIAAALSAAVRNAFLYRSLLESIDDLARARREAASRTSS